jgi:yecA family protein
MRRDWLNAAWQTDKGRQFESAEQAQMIMSLIMRMADDIAAALGVGEEFGPLMLGSTLESGEPVIVAQGWCWGFMAGMGSQFDAWEPHLDMLNELAGSRAKTLCRCDKFPGDYALCRQRAERQAPRAKFAQPGCTGSRASALGAWPAWRIVPVGSKGLVSRWSEAKPR